VTLERPRCPARQREELLDFERPGVPVPQSEAEAADERQRIAKEAV
jgi:hypothetical protein